MRIGGAIAAAPRLYIDVKHNARVIGHRALTARAEARREQHHVRRSTYMGTRLGGRF